MWTNGAPWQRLYFLPLPHGHGSFLPTFAIRRSHVHQQFYFASCFAVDEPVILSTGHGDAAVEVPDHADSPGAGDEFANFAGGQAEFTQEAHLQ